MNESGDAQDVLEDAVLGLILLGGRDDVLPRVRGRVPHPLVFSRPIRRMIYQGILDVDDAAERVDLMSVVKQLESTRADDARDRLRELEIEDARADVSHQSPRDVQRLIDGIRKRYGRGTSLVSALDQIGGPVVVAQLSDRALGYSSLDVNLGLLVEAYHTRRLLGDLKTLISTMEAAPPRYPEVVARLSALTTSSARNLEGTSTESLGTIIPATLMTIDSRRLEPPQLIKTTVSSIDNLMGGLRGTGLYVLAARPGVGKTSFALSIARGACRIGLRVLYVSLEIDRHSLAMRLLAAAASVDFKKLYEGTIDDHERQRIQVVSEQMGSRPLHIIDRSLTIHDLRATITREQMRLSQDGGLALVVVDYLQLIDGRPGQEEYARVSEVTRLLKLLALHHKIPIVALSQMSRDSEKGAKQRRPRLSDLRGSGSIEQDADVVLFLHREREEEGVAVGAQAQEIIAILAKNRFGPCGEAHLSFDGASMTFSELAEDDSATHEQDGQRGRRLRQSPSVDEDLFNSVPEPPA